MRPAVPATLATLIPSRVLLLCACATSRVEDTWTDPSVAGKPLEFREASLSARRHPKRSA